ncbi:MAG TPA: helix-turn-helix transcriptional regulator [Nanoarchaeota archaeon]|nr:helix-turn-helix transcriptional regulator [Nanoarchaeota archaeon]
MALRKITIYRLNRPKSGDVNQCVQWLSGSLGLFSCRDKSKSCFRIFVELLKAAKQRKALSSDEIAYRLHLSRGAVVHHLNNLIESGIVAVHKNRYLLREASMDLLVKNMKKEISEILEEMNSVAEEIDRAFGD